MVKVYTHDTVREEEKREGEYLKGWLIGGGIIVATFFAMKYFWLPPKIATILILMSGGYLFINHWYRKRHKRKFRRER